MKLGGNIIKKWSSPEEWAALARACGYSGVYFPADHTAPLALIDGYCAAAKAAGLTICEVGVWNNTNDPDPVKRGQAIERAIRQLELADYVGANCCVNISGSCRADRWDGPHPDNFSQRTFDAVVDTTQRIIDAVNPKNTAYTLEPMPWMLPSTPEEYLDLIRAIDRKGFGAHIDIVNIICSPALYYRNGDVIREWFGKLGPYIRSCHAKDIVLSDRLTVHLDECRPGLGALDYRAYLECMQTVDDRVGLMLEHMSEADDYAEGLRYLKGLGTEMGLAL